MKKRKIVFIYLLIGIAWILGTDYLVGMYASVDVIIMVQKIKGLLYVFLTAIFIYYYLGKIQELNNSKEQEQKLTTLINSMVDFVNFKDGEGRWLQANDYGLKLFQLEGVDYQGKKDSELAAYTDFYRDSLIYCETSDEEAWQNGKITRSKEVLPLPNGSEQLFDTIKVPLFYENGSRKGLVVIGRDITDLKNAEEQLRKSEKLSIVGELAASVGHEIRNPITSIKGFVQLLEKKDKENKTYYDIMLSELERINDIIGELLILAKPQKIQFSTCDLRGIVSDIVCLLETQARMENVTILFHADEEEFMIDCEKNQLKQLFINIIKNAIEATGEKGNVWVKLENKGLDKVGITVEDEGPGIPEEFLKRLGEPFYSSKEKGTGLGLTVSYKIIDGHGGTMEFSRVDKKRTKVDIELPIKKEKNSA